MNFAVEGVCTCATLLMEEVYQCLKLCWLKQLKLPGKSHGLLTSTEAPSFQCNSWFKLQVNPPGCMLSSFMQFMSSMLMQGLKEIAGSIISENSRSSNGIVQDGVDKLDDQPRSLTRFE
ncbi:hypothetical protein CK203_098064 [Vitis vinifera]|uniref:Uncharacterized protein n=1 Tax=Vitis vinifera TaxID=29760 RepID=A0A438CRX6_VITVI|nr:hypothetical protein CK203_098064 [Vitis vinifera]